MKLYGLIGHPLSHSFSKKFFTEKFYNENIHDSVYELFELKEIEDFPKLLAQKKELSGLNVTIPYKEKILDYLDHIDPAAKKIGAVNVIKFSNGKLTGFNSDYLGFKKSLISFLAENVSIDLRALILGTGGAAKAVKVALKDLSINYKCVSRSIKHNSEYINYNQIDNELLSTYRLIVNTTPLGMAPAIKTFPNLPYSSLSNRHYLYDLVYNPTETLFMKKGKENGAKVTNGLEMLILQAEESWRIWNKS